MELHDKSIFELREDIVSGKISCEEVVSYFIKRCEEKKSLNAVIEIYNDAIVRAKAVDEKIKIGKEVGKLAGVPVLIKDNIFYEGKEVTCASKFMQGFVAPYSATVVKKLIAEDAVIIGRTNMDEFAMGGSCEKSCYGACHNAHGYEYVSGGSSGGSAVAVAAGLIPLAIGTDTGGSIRQPASYNGVVGIKPTYGAVSRYGIVAFASSLDQASPLTKTIKECEFVLKIIAGKDENDQTSIDNKFDIPQSKKFTLGVCKEIIEKFGSMPGYKYYDNALQKLKSEFDIKEISIPHVSNSLACYYILAPAEATSNLARFDAVKYAKRSDEAVSLDEVYTKSRTEGFGKEVKRRIMLGNFVLSSGFYEAYYGKAKKLQRLIRQEFKQAFKVCDAIILPTTTGTAFKIGEKMTDPVSMYLEDLFTVPANIAGLPALSVPYAKENGLPIGMQFMADEMKETTLFAVAEKFKQTLEEN